MQRSTRLPERAPHGDLEFDDRALWASLSPAQWEFVRVLMSTGDAAEAWRRAFKPAFPTPKDRQKGEAYAKRSAVAAVIGLLRQREAPQLMRTREQVLAEIARVGFQDIRQLFHPSGALKAVSELDDDTAAALASLEVTAVGRDMVDVTKVKTWNKLDALKLYAEIAGYKVQRTEDVSKGGAFIVRGLDVDDAPADASPLDDDFDPLAL